MATHWAGRQAADDAPHYGFYSLVRLLSVVGRAGIILQAGLPPVNRVLYSEKLSRETPYQSRPCDLARRQAHPVTKAIAKPIQGLYTTFQSRPLDAYRERHHINSK